QAQQVRKLFAHLTENAYAEAGPWERMPVHHLLRQPELDPEPPHLVLEQLPQRLDELQAHLGGKPTDVVMRFDDMCLTRARARGFDDIGIDRALCEKLDSLELARLLLEHLDEHAPDDLALRLRVGDTGERIEEAPLGIDADHAHAEMVREGLHDLVALAETQQA